MPPDRESMPADHERARRVILEHGWNATCYQILNPGFERWYSARGDAVVGFIRQYGVDVVGGAPVCAKERLCEVVEEFEASRGRVCYFGAQRRLEEALQGDERRAHMVIGAQPVWDPHAWEHIIATHASLRGQLNRARNKDVQVDEWSSHKASNHPALRRCLVEWLQTRGLPPLHFLTETDTLSRLEDRRIFVALRKESVIGFLVASPIPARSGWLVEQLVRGRDAVNGSTELMLDASMKALAAGGGRFVTLGLAPLSPFAGRTNVHNPAWLRAMLAWMRAHGSRFYNFEGLEAYKAKFRPYEWEPLYAVVNEPRVKLSMLYAITAAFADGSPVGLLIRGGRHAVAREAERLRQRLQRGRDGG